MQMQTNPAERIGRIREELSAAALEKWGRVPEIIAVTKTVPPERINQIVGSGVTRLGENRVQEMLEKMPALNAGFQIDIIGRLQSNKVKYIIDKAAMIQSLDRESLAQEIDRQAKRHDRVMPVLIQVNIGREAQKGGVPVEELEAFTRKVASLDGMSVRGLMAVMPDLRDEDALRPFFREMRALFDRLRQLAIAGTDIRELSMGMSGDYRLAAEEGATHVRLGSALFGSRS